MTDWKSHWEGIYSDRTPDEVSWFQSEPALSLDLISRAGLPQGAEVLDLGSGASALVDRLLDLGYRVSALDVSPKALAASKERLGPKAERVNWIVADACVWEPARTFDLWHDRAVFHFMTEPGQRAGYINGLRKGLRVGGHLVVATFAPDGPEKCSGLPVRRYDTWLLLESLGPGFRLLHQASEEHRTPRNAVQKFQYYLLRREG